MKQLIKIATFIISSIFLAACSTIQTATSELETTIPLKPQSTLIMNNADTPSSGNTATSTIQETQTGDLMMCDGTIEYIPVPAFEAKDYTDMVIENNQVIYKREKFKGTTKEINALLPNLSMEVYVSELKAAGKVGGMLSSKLYHRKIVMDFMKSRTEPIVDQNNEFYGYGRVGAGLRLKINLWTTKTTFDGSLISLAATAEGETTYGRISVQSIGVNNADVTLSMPFTTDFSDGSIQKVIEALAIVKSKIHDTSGKTNLVPHFLARYQCKKSN